MTKLTAEQKRSMIDYAKKAYRETLYLMRDNGDAYTQGIDPRNELQESCRSITSLIYYIAKEVYGVPDEDNNVFHCQIGLGEGVHRYVTSHYINRIAGEYIDGSVEQFNGIVDGLTLSPYEFRMELYANTEEEPPMEAAGIQEELDCCRGMIAFDKAERIRSERKRHTPFTSTLGSIKKWFKY